MSFDTSMAAVLRREGGYVNDPTDRGGETNFGVTIGTARRNGFNGSMKDMTEADARAIYKQAYWDVLGLDTVAAMDAKLADRLFDIGVNMGVRTAGQFLQRALNLLNRSQKLFEDLKVDGAVGPGTQAALGALAKPDVPVLCKLIELYQGKRYIEIIEHDSTQERFTRGWINRLLHQAS